MRTAQELFDTVATHLLTQNRRSLKEGTLHSCMYRGTYGLKCAIGILIPDDVYTPTMEGPFVSGLLDRLPESLRNELRPHIVLLDTLQYLHDRVEVDAWYAQLSKVAERHSLKMVERP